MRARAGLTIVQAAGYSVVVAAVLVGLSVAAAVWAIEAGVLSHARSNRLDDVRITLAAAHDLVSAREQAASLQATRIAARTNVQSAFVRRDATTLRTILRSQPNVGFVLWDGRAIGGARTDLPHAAITVYSRGRFAGRVVVGARPDDDLLQAARRQAPGDRHLLPRRRQGRSRRRPRCRRARWRTSCAGASQVA